MKTLLAAAAVLLASTSIGCNSVGSIGAPGTLFGPPAGGSQQAAMRSGGRGGPMTSPAMVNQAVQQAGFASSCGAGGCCDTGCGDACCPDGYCGQGNCCGNGGCQNGCCPGCGQNGCGGRCGLLQNLAGSCMARAETDANYNFNPGPSSAQTAYPYYTVKGPRDFLMRKPPSIGPNGAYGCR